MKGGEKEENNLLNARRNDSGQLEDEEDAEAPQRWSLHEFLARSAFRSS